MQEPKARLWPAYIACYLLLALLVLLGAGTLFVWRWTLLELLPLLLPRSPWQQFIYGLTLMLLGGALFISVIVADYQLRAAVVKRQLLRRFMRLALPMAGVALLGLLLLWLSITLSPTADAASAISTQAVRYANASMLQCA